MATWANGMNSMDGTDGVIAERGDPMPGHNVSENGTPASVRGRVRVDGKFFARDGQRLRVQGVTYGPFAPGADGLPFPTLETVDEDFARMRAASINAIRTYHVPPEWFLSRADEQAID